MDLISVLPISITIIFIFIASRFYHRMMLKLPPGPFPWPLIGSLHHIKRATALSYQEWSQMYGPIISVWYGSNLNVIVSNPELAKEVLKDKDQQLSHRYRPPAVSKITKDGKDLIWSDHGPHHVRVRKLCTLELFCPKRIEHFRFIREEEVKAMVESISKHCIKKGNKCLVLRNYLGSVAFNHITRLVFGIRFENEQGVMGKHGLEIKAILAQEFSFMALTERIWWLKFLSSWLQNDALKQHLARREALLHDIKEKHEDNKKGTKNEYPLMHALLNQNQDPYGLGEDIVKSLIWDMITAGKDTIAIAAEWAMAQLVMNPQVQEKAQAELDCVIGPNSFMTETHISSLSYLQCIAKETLRLHPPTPMLLPHKANINVKVGGYDIPKGTNVHVNVLSIGRNEKVWEDPLAFRPERFLQQDIDIKGHDFRLFPFGSGRRTCPAAQLSINLVTLMLGQLLHKFYWTLPEGVESKDIDMSVTPGLVAYMQTPLEAIPIVRH